MLLGDSKKCGHVAALLLCMRTYTTPPATTTGQIAAIQCAAPRWHPRMELPTLGLCMPQAQATFSDQSPSAPHPQSRWTGAPPTKMSYGHQLGLTLPQSLTLPHPAAQPSSSACRWRPEQASHRLLQEEWKWASKGSALQGGERVSGLDWGRASSSKALPQRRSR